MPYRNSFVPEIDVVASSCGEHTILQMRGQPVKFVRIFMAIWFISLLMFELCFLVLAITSKLDSIFPVFVPIGMCAFGYLLCKLATKATFNSVTNAIRRECSWSHKPNFSYRVGTLLLVVFTHTYTTFSRSFTRKKSLLSTDKGDFFQWYPFLTERVIYLRYDIALSCDDICLRHMKERILYHACAASISYGLPYIISRQRYIIEQRSKAWYNLLNK